MLDLGTVRERLLKLAQVYGLKVNPDAPIWQLSVGEQQRVEIIKALYHGGALVILDEPTAVLTPQECSELFVTLKEMRTQGHALIFISHKLHEVQELSDRMTVMRDGRVIDTAPQRRPRPAQAGADDGRARRGFSAGAPAGAGRRSQAVAARPAAPTMIRGLPALEGVSLDVRAGEIVGLAGVSGNGQRELAEAIAGLRHVTGGEISIGGQNVAARVDRRSGCAPGCRTSPKSATATAIIGSFSVAENAILQNTRRLHARAFS